MKKQNIQIRTNYSGSDMNVKQKKAGKKKSVFHGTVNSEELKLPRLSAGQFEGLFTSSHQTRKTN